MMFSSPDYNDGAPFHADTPIEAVHKIVATFAPAGWTFGAIRFDVETIANGHRWCVVDSVQAWNTNGAERSIPEAILIRRVR